MKTNGHLKSTERLIAKVYASPRYRGQWLIVIHGKIFAQPSGVAGVRKLGGLLKRYPGETPTIVYVPLPAPALPSPFEQVKAGIAAIRPPSTGSAGLLTSEE